MAGIAPLTLALAGCLDLDETITFHADGTVTLQSTIAMDAGLAAESGGSVCDETPPDGVTLSTYTQGADLVCAMSGQFTLDGFQDYLQQRGNAQETDFVTLSETDDGWRLDVAIAPDASFASSGDPAADELSRTLLLAIAADRSLNWTVRASRILATDGVINAAGDAATVSIPLIQLFEASDGPVTRYIAFQIDELPFWQRLFD